jgi:putative FmdB family regulatory protein
MPIFEYKCEDCGSRFEKLVRRSDAEQVLCPSCGKSHLEQQHSVFAAHANGSPREAAMPSCAGGMCQTPDFCGRNN